eukprot:15380269-Alexandrium_andersonii.AAC.1
MPVGSFLFVKVHFYGHDSWVAVAGGSPLRALAMPASGLGFLKHPGGSWTRGGKDNFLGHDPE